MIPLTPATMANSSSLVMITVSQLRAGLDALIRMVSTWADDGQAITKSRVAVSGPRIVSLVAGNIVNFLVSFDESIKNTTSFRDRFAVASAAR